MIRNIFALTLLLGVVTAFPQAPPPPGPEGLPPLGPDGLPPHPPGCLPPPPPGPPGSSPASLPPQAGPDGNPLPKLPPCPPTLIPGHCGGKTYYWDTAKGETEPEEFKKCFFGEGPVGAICNGKEYSWEPSKESKPKDLETCEQEFNARMGAPPTTQ